MYRFLYYFKRFFLTIFTLVYYSAKVSFFLTLPVFFSVGVAKLFGANITWTNFWAHFYQSGTKWYDIILVGTLVSVIAIACAYIYDCVLIQMGLYVDED